MIPWIEDDISIIETVGGALPSAYMTGVGENDNYHEIIFSEELGLAIEAPPEGVWYEDLWKII